MLVTWAVFFRLALRVSTPYFTRLLLSLVALGSVGLARAQSTCTPPPTALVNWWPGDENAKDIVGKSDGTPQGNLTFAPGEVGAAFTFNGSAAVTFGSAGTTLGTSDFTAAFWLNTRSTGVAGVLGKRLGCTHNHFFDVRILDNTAEGGGHFGQLLVELDQGDGVNYNAVITSQAINDGAFHLIAVVRQGTTVVVYIDGVRDSQGTTPQVVDVTNAGVLTAGQSACNGAGPNVPLIGQMDEIAIFSRALDIGEIQAIFKAGSAGMCKSCQVSVQRLGQGDPRWASNLYDHSSTVKIGQDGCALTSLSMALNNVGASNDPGFLNTFMAATDNDYSGLAVNWGPATRDFSGGTLKFHANRIDSTVDLQGAKQYLDTNVCQQHHPVIVGVNLDADGTPGHYVLVTGKKNNDYTIADPGFARTTLSQYDNEFVTRGFVADPPGDLSELDLAMGDVAETLVTDPLGHQTGFDPNLQKIVEQIPTSAYFRDSLQDDVTGAPATETDHLTEIFQPTQGTYQIVVNGIKLGTYSLSVRTFSQDGSSQPGVLIPGIAGPGSNSSFSIQLTSTPGSTSTVKVAATSSSTLADISNSLQLGLIDNHGIANSLSEKIEAAQGATEDAHNNILNAFINEVNAQAGKHITGVAVQVLLADADALLVH